MTLKEYLAQEAMPALRFAKRAGVDSSTIDRLLAGQMPRIDTIKRIEQATGGAVGFEDWVSGQ